MKTERQGEGAQVALCSVRLACFTYLLHFRDSYGLLDHLNSDGFDYWSDRLFHFPRGFLTGAGLGLALATVRFVALALADLVALRALPRAVAIFPALVDAPLCCLSKGSIQNQQNQTFNEHDCGHPRNGKH